MNKEHKDNRRNNFFIISLILLEIFNNEYECQKCALTFCHCKISMEDLLLKIFMVKCSQTTSVKKRAYVLVIYYLSVY